MKYATFNTITVHQYQRLYEVSKTEDDDKDMQLVSILTGRSLTQVEDMTIVDFNAACRRITEIFSTEVKSKPKRFVRVSGKKYRIIYNPAKLSAAAYVEVNTWLKDGAIQNLNKIMASIIHPINFFGFKVKRKLPHSEISAALLEANFSRVHAACVFFSLLWQNSIKALADSLDKWETAKMSIEQRQKMKKVLQIASGGFTTRSK